ncbi:MAG: hypothetical protein ACP6IP_05595 [Candidatus Njordarchaeia archaeon]
MDKSMDLLEDLKKFGEKEETIRVKIFGSNEDFDYKISKQIIRIINPLEETAKKSKDKNGREIFQRTYTVKSSPMEIMYKLMVNLKSCFVIRKENHDIIIEDIKCPPCQPGATTKITTKHYLLSGGRIIEKESEERYKVYTCKLKKE